MSHYYFVLEQGRVHFPLVRALPRRSLRDDLVGLDPALADATERLFREAERLELRAQRLDMALHRYRELYELRLPDSLKAVALSRIARCLHKLEKTEEVQQAYMRLGKEFGELYDPFFRPYAMVAALALDDLNVPPRPPFTKQLEEVAPDVLGGRWELSADQVQYFLQSLKAFAPDVETKKSAYLEHLTLASQLQDRFHHTGQLDEHEIYTLSISDSSHHQLFYRPISITGKEDTFVAFAVDLAWVEATLLPQAFRGAGVAETLSAKLIPSDDSREITDTAAQRATFSSLFPFWALSIRPTTDALQASARGELLIFGGTITLVVLVLGLGVFVLLRDASHELQMAQARNDFVSGVSHELKTPLTLIRLYGETLLHGATAPPTERKGFYRIILRESERLTHLIEKVLDFARIGRGQKEYRLSEGDLAPVVSRTVDAYQEYLKRRGFSMSADIGQDLPVVRFDPEAVAQALVNLIDNAEKYSGESKYLGVSLVRRLDEVVLSVEDHGLGISPTEQQRIFEEFYRAPRDKRKGGYGLGLFLIRHIMGAHGGRVEVESAPGRGTTFSLFFPVVPSDPEPTPDDN